MNSEANSKIESFLNYAKKKKIINWDEINYRLGQAFVNSPKMEKILKLLMQNDVQIMEEDNEDDGLNDELNEKILKSYENFNYLNWNQSYHKLESDSHNINNFYLSKIEKEQPLTAEQEIYYFKQLEYGENIIKDEIKNSGLLISEFFEIANKIFSKFDSHNPEKTPDEIKKEQIEKQRLKKYYENHLVSINKSLVEYINLKNQFISDDNFKDFNLAEYFFGLRKKITLELNNFDIQHKEIEKISKKFICAAKDIIEYENLQEETMCKLNISDFSEVQTLISKMSNDYKISRLEKQFGIRKTEIIENLLNTNNALKKIENDFEEGCSKILLKASIISRGKEIYKDAKNKIIKPNLPLVISIAKRYLNYEMELSDLIQEGNIGLIKAIDKFEYRKLCKFSIYAVYWIQNAIVQAIYNQSRIIRLPVHANEKINRINSISSYLEEKLNRKPTNAEIAEKLGWKTKRLVYYKNIQQNIISLETPLDDFFSELIQKKCYEKISFEDFFELKDIIKDEFSKSPEEFAINEILKKQVSEVLSTLPNREQQVIKMRFGLYGGYSLTKEEVGFFFNVTRERIRQIEAKALRRLKHPRRTRILRGFIEI